MKVIALLPVRNEAWVLRHSLACLSGFCDVIIVNDQNSEDESRDVCRTFPKVVLLEQSQSVICGKARWQLWDAARNYDGDNLLWCTDPDELMSPSLAREFIARQRDALAPGVAIECLFYHPPTPDRYRDDTSLYGPYWKPLAAIDDRRMDYDRSIGLPLHEYRVPFGDGTPVVRAENFPVFHLQWLIASHNQMKQAWYRCIELLTGRKTPAAINEFYKDALPWRNVRTAPIPPAWVQDVTFPDTSIDRTQSWQEREVVRLFDQHGVELFEPLEIWHIPRLREEFERRVGRRPRADRSYLPSWSTRAHRFKARVVAAARRRLTPHKQ